MGPDGTADKAGGIGMQTYTGDRANEQYLAQRIVGATSEQLLAMLLEGGQKFIGLANASIQKQDVAGKTRYLHRTAEIVSELMLWLDPEESSDLVKNMGRIYDWWLREIYDASRTNDTARLSMVSHQMGEIRSAVEEWLRKNRKETSPVLPAASAHLDGMVG